ncbi:hypothetical protein HBI73_072530 [Parastagonospora nodorum]|nr:hypothetical protein HBI73_072530 [Parastagonospora nodorum]
MLQTNIREEYRITTLEIVKLIENLISYIKKKNLLKKIQLEKTLITNKFSIALLTKLAILNNANITLVDAMHYSIQKLEENYFKVRAQHLKYDVIDALTITLIKDDNDLLSTVNSYIKPPLKRRKTKLGKKAQLKKTRDKEELAKLDSLLDSNDYRLDSSLDINSKNNLEDEKATTDTFTLRTRQKCKMRKQKATQQNITQLTITISYILLKARERSTARIKGAFPLTPNLNKQLQ